MIRIELSFKAPTARKTRHSVQHEATMVEAREYVDGLCAAMPEATIRAAFYDSATRLADIRAGKF